MTRDKHGVRRSNVGRSASASADACRKQQVDRVASSVTAALAIWTRDGVSKKHHGVAENARTRVRWTKDLMAISKLLLGENDDSNGQWRSHWGVEKWNSSVHHWTTWKRRVDTIAATCMCSDSDEPFALRVDTDSIVFKCEITGVHRALDGVDVVGRTGRLSMHIVVELIARVHAKREDGKTR